MATAVALTTPNRIRPPTARLPEGGTLQKSKLQVHSFSVDISITNHIIRLTLLYYTLLEKPNLKLAATIRF